jgi:DNA polymerase type B, organellar and viral
MSPVCISVYDGINVSSFYLSNFENSDKMLLSTAVAAIESIMKPCYKNNVVYLHNFSYFDAVFLIKILSSFNAKISPIIRDNCIIDYRSRSRFSNNKFSTLYFRDSYLLIPSSLSNLSRVFKVLKKDIFPYNFLKLGNINYTGKVPLFEEFDNISLEDYNKYVNNYKPHTDKE